MSGDWFSGLDICQMEGHTYSRWGSTCRSCGDFNGALFSYYGQVARRAKRDGVSREEAERLMAGTVEEAQFRGTRCGECGMFSDWHQPRCPQYPPTRAGHGRGGAVMAQTFDPATHSAIDDILGHVANEGFEGWATYWDDHRVFGDRIVSLLLEWLEFVKSHTEAGE